MKNFIHLIFLFFISTISYSQVTDSFTSLSTDFKVSSKNEYTVIESSKTSNHTQQIGAPQLPIYTLNYVLPAGSVLTNVSASNMNKTTLGTNYYIYPTQPPCTLDGKPCPDFVIPDAAIYNSATPFPESTVTVAGDATTFGYHLVTINICPFEYIPNQRKLSLYNQVNIIIQYSIGQVDYQVKISERRNKLNKDFIKATVQNPSLITVAGKTANTVVNDPINTNKLHIPWKPSAYGDIPDYIIITNEALKPYFDTFATYKTQRGIPTLLVTVEQIYQNYPGCDQAEKIRNYLRAAYQYWGAGLFVLLGGDTAVVPSRIATHTPSLDGSKHTDLYYCDVYKPGILNYNWNSSGDSFFGVSVSGIGNGTDICELGADNFIGRAPVDTVEEATNFINKIIKYEKLEGVTNTSYVNNMLFLGSYYRYFQDINSGNPDGQNWHFQLANKPFLASPLLNKWLLFDDYVGPPHHNYPGSEELNKVNAIDRLNNGSPGIGKFHLVSHYDHGSPWGIGVSSSMKSNGLSREDMDVLSNGNSYQIMYSTACEDGEFQRDCFAEHFVNAPNGGGVAMIANSGTVNTGANEQDNKLFNSIYGNFSPTSYIMGVAFANARDAVNNADRKKRLTLFGDPSMITWSATPQNIVLTVPTSVTIDNAIANILPVTINVLTNDATVTLYKYNTVTQGIEVYASTTIPAGNTSAQFTLNPDTEGILTVKVTAKNYLPATANVNILLPQAHLYVTNYGFTDGNGNGVIEQGETINLTIYLTNSGNTNISCINTVLSCNPAFATVTNATVTYAQINAGQTIPLIGFTFVAQVANGAVVLPDFIEFFLNITADGNYSHLDYFYLDLKNPILNLGARTLTDDSNAPITNFTLNQNVNLKAVLKNIGNVETGVLTATLSTTMSSSIVTISTPTVSYSSIQGNSEQINSSPFVFKFVSTPPTGSKPYTITVTNALGKTWMFNFDLNEPLPPLITNFHFTSTIDEIKLMWTAPSTNVQGYNIYRSNSENGAYVKLNNLLVTGSSFYTDSGLSLLSTFYYKISVVTPLGNELPLQQVVTNDSAPKQGYKAWTTLAAHGGFPVQASSEIANKCNSSPTLFDIDNNNTKEIFSNCSTEGNEALGRIMGFYNSGPEIYNIDGNETTVSGYAATNLSMWSNSAIGDIDNDGHPEILSNGRNNDSNQGKLFVYKSVDNDGDNKPDKFWNDEAIDFGWRTIRNPVLYDVDGNGFLDIIVVDEHEKVYVYDKDKNLMSGWPQQIGDGTFTYDYSQGHIAVADLDHDGKGEIAIGLKSVNAQGSGGIYIWKYNGTPFTVNPFKEFAVNERADCGIVLADIDNDLNLDILATTKQGTLGKIYAFKIDGTPVDSTWNGTFSFNVINTQYNEHTMPRIAIGDLNHDSNLEIVFGSYDNLYVLDRYGNSFSGNFPKPINNMFDNAPTLADIDTDGDIEIVFNNEGTINAYNIDGSQCVGFPLENQAEPFTGSVSIDDIDNDGKNEIVVCAKDASVYAFETDGDPNKIEWGSYRGNPRNTGTYKEVCNNVLDLMVRDGLTDVGDEPDNVTPYMWTSPDIWIRNNDDSIYEPQNAEYSPSSPNFAYVRVTNKSCVPTTGAEHLTLYWAKAGISFDWPNTWDGNHYFPIPNDNVRLGQPVGTMLIPVIQPGQTAIVRFPFMVPNPADYNGLSGAEPWHFCMLARIEAESDMPIETVDLYENVKNNNNLGWVNFSIIDAVPDVGAPKYSALVAVGNPYDEPHNFFIEIVKEDTETGKDIYNEAEVSIKMNDVLYNAWERGGKESQRVEATLDEKKKIVTGNHVLIENLLFNANEMGMLNLRFNFLTEELTEKTKFVYHVIQKDAQTGKILGGETYIIRKKQRPIFIADAGGDKEVDAHQPITISAAEISEPVIYNWYDSKGNLIFTGKNLQIADAVAEKYKLEVISTVDGFKDYSEMEVKINPNRLISVGPNTVNENTTIYYNLDNVSSAYLMVVSYYMNGGVSNNYVLDVNSSQTNIDFSSYPNGFYKVILIANGVPSGMKIIYKQ